MLDLLGPNPCLTLFQDLGLFLALSLNINTVGVVANSHSVGPRGSLQDCQILPPACPGVVLPRCASE